MAKYTAKQPDQNGLIQFTEEENGTWQLLIERQMEVIQGRACQEFIEGLQILNFPRHCVPQYAEVSEVLQAITGWSIVPVPAMIPLSEFFRLLANAKFPAASFIRRREELDYLQEPDIFHELFGHCPLLTKPAYADFLRQYGEIALTASEQVRSLLGRLFWFTVEFGLLNTTQGLRIYGAGILSSYAETLYALENSAPQRLPFTVRQVLDTPYRYDVIQDRYFVLNDLKELLQLKMPEIAHLAEMLIRKPEPAEDFVTC